MGEKQTRDVRVLSLLYQLWTLVVVLLPGSPRLQMEVPWHVNNFAKELVLGVRRLGCRKNDFIEIHFIIGLSNIP